MESEDEEGVRLGLLNLALVSGWARCMLAICDVLFSFDTGCVCEHG